MAQEIAVLVIGYQRLENIAKILEIVKKNKIKRIYISIDGPRSLDLASVSMNHSIRELIGTFKKNFDGQIIDHYREINRGCAASVISSCNWIFSKEKYAIVLEDDCIPSDGFFEFINTNFQNFDEDSNLVIVDRLV